MLLKGIAQGKYVKRTQEEVLLTRGVFLFPRIVLCPRHAVFLKYNNLSQGEAQ
jgi:hypothetical protein